MLGTAVLDDWVQAVISFHRESSIPHSIGAIAEQSR